MVALKIPFYESNFVYQLKPNSTKDSSNNYGIGLYKNEINWFCWNDQEKVLGVQALVKALGIVAMGPKKSFPPYLS